MVGKPTYEELELRVKELEKEAVEYKRTTEAIKDSEERFRLIFESSNDVILVHQVGKIKDVNRKACELTGYSREQLLSMSILDLFQVEDQSDIKNRLKRNVRAGHTIFETRWKRADGRTIDVEVSSSDFDPEKGIRVGITRDITDRKNAEEALRESEEFSSSLLENSSIPILVINPDSSIRFINPAFEELTGYSSSEIIGEKAPYRWGCNDPESGNIRETSDMLSRGVHCNEKLFQKKNGERFWVESSTIPIKRNGELKYELANWIDITERRQAEEALLKSEARYKSIFQDNLSTIFIRDPETESLIDVNPAGCSFYGYSRDEMIGFELTKITHHPLEKIKKRTKQTLFDGKNHFIAKHYLANGEERDVEVYNNLITIGDKKVILSIIHDITERKQAEEALKESEVRYKDLYENAPVGYMEYNNKGHITSVNRKELEMLGYTVEEMLGKPAWNFVTEKEKGRELIKAKLAGKKSPSKNLERAYIRKDGTTFPSLIEDVIFKDKTGRVIGIRSTIQDISDRKRAEEKLRESEERLARSKKMESLGLLAGGVAHDLNNVLSGIVSYPELLLLDLSKDSKLRKPIETIQESGNKAVAIVLDLLTIARGVASTKKPLNLNDIVEEYLASPEFKKLEQFHPKVTFKINLDNHLLNISGSLVHIRKAIMNLVSNASEAIEDRGNVIISTRNRYLDRPMRGYEDLTIGEYAVLTVSDDGSGILSDHLEKIFEPFFTKKVMGRSGTGLGLAVVWNIVQDHHGHIDVMSDKNSTKFEIYFPITRDEVIDTNLSVPIEGYKGCGETILVVDDVETQRDISCRMLNLLGYKTKALASGEEAVEYLKKNRVDLIFLDMIMDLGINGRETYERIIKIHPNQKAIIVSGFAETDEVKEAQKLGAGQYVRKPLTLGKIGAAVKKELGGLQFQLQDEN